MGRRPTIKDVAAASGVSITTVSHALTGAGRVSPTTKARVAQAVVELGYSPRRSARSLRSGSTGTLALLSPAVGDLPADHEALGLDFYMRLTAELARRAFHHDRAVLLLPHTRDTARLRRAELDGAILSDPERSDPVLTALLAADVPVVTLERNPDEPNAPTHVRANHAASTRRVLDHFAEQGSQRPGLLIPDLTWSWVIEVRQAYVTWCGERGCEPLVCAVSSTDAKSAAYVSAERLLSRPDRPDAIFALTERYASSVMRVAASQGLAVPDDLLLASGVESPYAPTSDPPLTTVAHRPEEQGTAAVDLLLDLLDGRKRGPVVVEADLVVRASSLRR